MALNQEEFIKRMQLFDESALNITEFCKLHGFSKTRFYKYRREQLALLNPTQPVPPQFESISVLPTISSSNPIKAVVSFPNSIRCEVEFRNSNEQLKLLKELASL